MKTHQGQTLIELIIFIVIISLILGAALAAFQTVLRYSSQPGSILTASQLANARMNLIIQQREINGFSLADDPCRLNPTLGACLVLQAFADAHGYTFNSTAPTIDDDGIKTVIVNVAGKGNATISVGFDQ